MSPRTIIVGSSKVHLRNASTSISTAMHRPALAAPLGPGASQGRTYWILSTTAVTLAPHSLAAARAAVWDR
eukprot:5936358-Lingulodinium_polyedra.AAC.1